MARCDIVPESFIVVKDNRELEKVHNPRKNSFAGYSRYTVSCSIFVTREKLLDRNLFF